MNGNETLGALQVLSEEINREFSNYLRMKYLDKKSVLIRERVKELLYDRDDKRTLFTQYGMVARFSKREKKAWKHAELMEFLTDHFTVETLVKNGLLDYRKLNNPKLKDYLIKKPDSLKLVLNGFGKQAVRELFPDFDYESELFDSVLSYKRTKQELKDFKAENEIFRDFLIKAMQENNLNRVNFDGGYYSITKGSVYIPTSVAFQVLPEDEFLKDCKIVLGKLNDFASMGYIGKKVLNDFYDVEDITVVFSIMELEDEQKMFDFLGSKQKSLQKKAIK